MKELIKTDLVSDVLKNVDKDIDDEEIIHLVLEENVSDKLDDEGTFAERMADKLAQKAGSWGFIISFSAALVIWIIVNIILATKAFDPYPFILLNLVLSCVAAIQAPVIMMSQNRQDEKDRKRAENDYRVNLKTEIIIQDLHKKLDLVLEQQEKILKQQEMDKKNK